MQLGHLNEIDQAQVNHVTQIQKVQEVDNEQKINPDEQYKNIKPNEIIDDSNEVMLDNVKFGFNKKSQDFFIKITRGEVENKYPTDYMMKLKATFMDAYKEQVENLNK
jgi:hypothetical protein